MWVPSQVIEWFSSMRAVAETNAAVSIEAVNHYREELSALRAERDSLKSQLLTTQIHFDWIRMQLNSLQAERVALMEKAYNIKLPVPEIIRTPVMGENTKMSEFSFDDIGDELARKIGLPLYDMPKTNGRM